MLQALSDALNAAKPITTTRTALVTQVFCLCLVLERDGVTYRGFCMVACSLVFGGKFTCLYVHIINTGWFVLDPKLAAAFYLHMQWIEHWELRNSRRTVELTASTDRWKSCLEFGVAAPTNFSCFPIFSAMSSLSNEIPTFGSQLMY